jgi:hypothetical protein
MFCCSAPHSPPAPTPTAVGPRSAAGRAARDEQCQPTAPRTRSPVAPHRCAQAPDALGAEDRIEAVGELRIPVTDEEPELPDAVPRSMSRLRACGSPRLPSGLASPPGCGPGGWRVRSPTATSRRLQQHRVDVEHVARQQALSLDGQELPPGQPSAARCRIDAGPRASNSSQPRSGHRIRSRNRSVMAGHYCGTPPLMRSRISASRMTSPAPTGHRAAWHEPTMGRGPEVTTPSMVSDSSRRCWTRQGSAAVPAVGHRELFEPRGR